MQEESLKHGLGDLAIAGGEAAFKEPLHVGRPNIVRQDALLERIRGVLDRGWLTNNGPLVQEFETRVARLTGARHCVAVCNGYSGMELVLAALDLRGEVLVPSMTFVSTPHALQWRGITPVFCDIDQATLCMDPAAAERAITSRTSAVIPTHLFGAVCDVEAFEGLARRRGIALVFDSAHAFGCSHAQGMVGGAGRAEVFSFHATKFVNSFEGGAITTNDDALAQKLRLMRNFGFSGQDNVVSVGINAKMSEAAAAMGLTSLEDAAVVVEVNRRNRHRYRSALSAVSGIGFPDLEPENSNCQYVAVLVGESCPLDRDSLHEVLRAENVLARRYFYPGVHRMEPYRTLYPGACRTLPNTEQAVAGVLCLPTGLQMDDGKIDILCSMVETACRHPEQVRSLLARRTTSGKPGTAG